MKRHSNLSRRKFFPKSLAAAGILLAGRDAQLFGQKPAVSAAITATRAAAEASRKAGERTAERRCRGLTRNQRASRKLPQT